MGRSVKRNGKWRVEYLHHFVLRQGKGVDVDHIDGDRLNNVRANLRTVHHHMNMHNTHKARAGTTGIHPHPNGSYRVRLMVEGVYHHIGYFKTLETAQAARRAARIRLLGEDYA